MKTKITAMIISIFMLALTLCGCMHNDVGVKLNEDGTGSISATFGIEKESYAQFKDMGSDPFEGKETKEYTYNGKTYVSYCETKEYSTFEEIEKALLDLTYETELLEGPETEIEESSDPSNYTLVIPNEEKADNHIFKSVSIKKNSGIFYTVYSFNATFNPMKNTENYEANDVFRVTVSAEMPNKITQARGGKVDGNKIVWEIDDISSGEEIAAIAEHNNSGVLIGIISFLVVAFGLFVFIIKRKQNQGD